mmetsp:Transcript_99531/g.310097  ORF Transcript_99531/g.310097 Transcript_99531/m.310097 type:complete len:251 (+) Transcript_99531:474-1226(+)
MPPAGRDPQRLPGAEHGLEAEATQLLEAREGASGGIVKIDSALAVLRVVHRPRVEAAKVAWVEEEHPLVAADLGEEIVLGVVVARREVALRAAEELAHLRVTVAHGSLQPVPVEVPDVARHLDAASDAEASYGLRRTGLVLLAMQQGVLQVEGAGLLPGLAVLLRLAHLAPELREAHLLALVGHGQLVATRILLSPHVVVGEAALALRRRAEDKEVVHIAEGAVQVVKVPLLRRLPQHPAVGDDNGHGAA